MDSAEKIEISVYLDRIEELEDGGAEAVLLIDEGGEDYSSEFGLPTNFLPADASDGDYLTFKISRVENPREDTTKISAGENPVDETAETSAKISVDETADTSANISSDDTAENEIRATLETLDGEDAELTADGSKLIFPANFLPEDASAGEIFTIEITRDENKTNAALDEARQLLKELE